MAWGVLGGRPVLATGGMDGMVRLWDPERAEELRTLTEHDEIRALAWGVLGGRPVLATGYFGGMVRLWDPERAEELATLTGHTYTVHAVAWGMLGGRPVLATGSKDGMVRLWDPERAEELAALTGHDDIWALAWGVLGGRPVLATGSGDGIVRLWDPERAEELAALTGHTDTVYAVAWGVLGGRPVLATGSQDNTVRLWGPVVELVRGRVSGYRSDDPGDPDRLNRDPEAAALAEMITARSVSPPLAIGLFGDWGEGKTHLLRRIADHVKRLALVAGDDPEDRLTNSAVRQVHFNAWHYAETDLWASLVAELFSQMAAAAPADGGKPADRGLEERRQSRLAAEVATRRRLPERLRAAQDRQQALQQKLDELDELDDWQLLLRLDPQQQADLVALAGDEPAKLYRSMRAAANGIGGTARLAWRFCAVALRSRWFWMGFLLVAAATVVLVVARGPLGRLLGTVAGLAALLGTTVQTVRSSLTKLKDQAKPVIEQVQQHVEDRRRRLQTAFEVATAQADALQAELHELTPAGQITALVERRGRRDSPYRAQLGLMTQIREDFEEMARLLGASANQPSTESGVDDVGDELPRIDRIVVYIDDLDRCPPDRVVQVLEAVQLLLAIPLFVVVVAVDPRWLLRCLTVHYRELFEAANPVGASRDGSWGSTPMQYLEKIFQIPFTLPPVDQAGYTTMIDALTASAPGPDRSARSPDGRSGQFPPPDPAGAAAGPTTVTAMQSQSQSLPPAPVVERFDPLALTDDERQFMTLIGPPLLTTPRSIKRLVNSYGLLNALRGSRHEHDLREASHAGTGRTYHPYRAAIALLGILIAFPDLAPAFFPRLLRVSSCIWPQFLKRICPEESAGRWSSELLGDLATEAEALHWRALISALEKLTADATTAGLPLPEPLDAWAQWVVPVGRLSFETGRSVATLSSPSVSVGQS